MREDAKTKGVVKIMVRRDDLVTLVKEGVSLCLVEPAGSDNPSKRTWVPASFLQPLTKDADEEEEVFGMCLTSFFYSIFPIIKQPIAIGKNMSKVRKITLKQLSNYW